MRTSIAILVAIAALGGCKKQLKWSEKKLTTIEAGPFTIPIPAGWRDTRACFPLPKIWPNSAR